MRRFIDFFDAVCAMFVGNVPNVQVFYLWPKNRGANFMFVPEKFQQVFGEGVNLHLHDSHNCFFVTVCDASKISGNVGPFPLVAVWNFDDEKNRVSMMRFNPLASVETKKPFDPEADVGGDVESAFGRVVTDVGVPTMPDDSGGDVR